MLFATLAAYCGDLRDALSQFDAAQEVAPLFPACRANRGVAYYFAGQLNGANRVFLDLLTEYPQRTATRLSRANPLTLRGAFEAASGELNALIEHDPDDASARPALAVLTAREGDKRQARKIVNSARARGHIKKSNPSPLAAVYAQLGELEEAMTWLTLAADSIKGGFAEAQVDPMPAPLVGSDAFHALLVKVRTEGAAASSFFVEECTQAG